MAIVPHYGRPAAKVRGRGFVMRTGEPGSFAVCAAHDAVEMLIETEPDAFWQSPHWRGHAAILVREDAADAARVAVLIERAWAARASGAQRAERA